MSRDIDVIDLSSQTGLEPVVVEFAVKISEALDQMSQKMQKLQ